MNALWSTTLHVARTMAKGKRGAGQVASWIVGGVMGAFGLFGLLVASRAHEGPFYYFGLGLFALGVIVIYAMILRITGHAPRHGDPGRQH
jgi:hypothetical protein